MRDVAEGLERAYRFALLLQGRLADCGDEAAFERMTLAGELVAQLDDTRAAPAPADMRRAAPQDAFKACTVHVPSARSPS